MLPPSESLEVSMYSEGIPNDPHNYPTVILHSGYVDEEILRHVPKSHTTLGVKAAQFINNLKMGYRGLWKDEVSTCLLSTKRTFLYKYDDKYICTFLSVMDPLTLFSEIKESENKNNYDSCLEELIIKPILDYDIEEKSEEEQISNKFEQIKEKYCTNEIFKFEFLQFSLKHNRAYIILKKGLTGGSEFNESSEIFIIYPLYENKCSIMLSEYKIVPTNNSKKPIVESEIKRKVSLLEEIDRHHRGEITAEDLTSLNPEGLMEELQLPRVSTLSKVKRMSSYKRSVEISSLNNENDESDEIKISDYMGPFDSSYSGNGEIMTPPERIMVVLGMLRSGDYIAEAIRGPHKTNVTKGKNILLVSNEVNGHYAFRKDYERHSKGGLVYINSELLVKQKKVISYLLRKISTNIFLGRGVMNISLPVTVFEPRSFLERFARSFGYAPDYLERAGACPDPIERIKLVICFFLASLLCCNSQEKPFNPVLGETFQARINGNPVYLEQVCHHPPHTNYLMIGKHYKLHGTHFPIVNLSPNTLVAEPSGIPTVEFPLYQSKIKFRWPKFTITGLSLGSRIFNFISKAVAYDYKNRIYGEVNYNCQNNGFFSSKPIDLIGGGIYSVDPSALLRLECEQKHFNFHLKQHEIHQKVSTLEGVWNDHIKFEGVTYFSLDDNRPYLLEYEPRPLPSDCTFREDVLYLRAGNEEESQIKKEEIEQFQRSDKRLRESNKINY